MNRTLLSTMLFFATFICYGQRLLHDPNIPVQKSRIIMEQVRGGTVSENLTDLQYIPLGGGKNDIIDHITSAVYTNHRIAIVNNENGYLFIYDDKGTLVKKITKIEGYKPKEKRVFYSVQKEGDKLVLFGHLLKVTLDYDGNVLESDLDYQYKQEQPSINLGDAKYIYGRAQVQRDSFPEFALKLNDSILVHYDRRDTINSFAFQGELVVKVSEEKGFAVFSPTYSFFELNPKGITMIHQFVFPLKNTIDSTNFAIHKDAQKFYDYIIKNQEKIYGIGQPLRYKQYLILRIASVKLGTWIAYNIETGDILSLNKILPDKSNDFLEFLDRNQLSTDGEYLYSLIFPNTIQRARDKGRNEEHTMRDEYVKLEKSLNPILVRFKLN